MSKLFRIVYCSRSLLTGSRAEIEVAIRQILATARRNNRAAHLTGALAFTDNCFAQVLEGSLEDLAPVFARIRHDPRHTDLKILEQTSPESRAFSRWSMAFVDTPDSGGDHPLAHFSFEAALADGAGPEAEQVLHALRRLVIAKSKVIAA